MEDSIRSSVAFRNRFQAPGAKVWIFLLLLLMLQLGLVALDTTPRYLLGDSASYLWSIIHDGPFDRSWTYPKWFLKPLVRLHSIHLVVYVQCALGLVPALLAFRLVGTSSPTQAAIALATAILCVLEPLALTYQRYILTDSLGLALSASTAFCCAALIDRRDSGGVSAVLAPVCAVLAASLRTSQATSLATLIALTLFLLVFLRRNYAKAAIMLSALVVCQLLFSDFAFRHQGTYGYNALSGHFFLAAVLPIVSRADVEPYLDPEQAPALLAAEARDRRARPMELFSPDMAIHQIDRAFHDQNRGSRVATQIATRAIMRAPLDFLDLAFTGYRDYFDDGYIRKRVYDEVGRSEFTPAELLYFRETGIYDVANTANVPSPIASYFQAAWRYYGLVPIISAVLFLVALAVDRRASTLTLAAFSIASAASHIAFSTEPVPRYMIVSAWINIVILGRLANSLRQMVWTSSRSQDA